MNKLQRLPLGGSVDLDGKPHAIDDGSLRKAQNIIPDKDGYPGRRGGFSYVQDLLRVVDSPVWCHAPEDFDDKYLVLATDGSKADLYSSGDGIGTGASIRLRTAKPLVSLPCAFSFGGVTYILYGQGETAGAGVKLVKDLTATYGVALQAFPWNDSQLLVTKPRYVSPWRSRHVFAHFDGDYRGTVVISDTDDPLTIGVNALTDYGIDVTGGKDITGVHEVLATGQGSPASAIALVFTRERSYYLSGDLPETNDVFDAAFPLGTLAINKLSSNAGCISHHSVADTPYGTFWCGPTDVWFLPLGSLTPIPIGRRLKPLLKAQPESEQHRIQAVYANGFYRLQLFSDGQGPDGTTPHGEQWWLDLRNGAPTNWKEAQWRGPMVFRPATSTSEDRGVDVTVLGTYSMMLDARPRHEGALLGVQSSLSVAGTQGITLVRYDTNEPRDVSGIYRNGLVPWRGGTAYQVGDEIVVATTSTTSLSIWRAFAPTGDQASGSVEPTWDSGTSPITDNHITWGYFCEAISPAQMKGSEVLTLLETKDYTFADLMTDKLWQGVELSHFLTVPERLKITQLVDGGKTVEEITADCYQSSGPVIGTDIVGQTALLAEEFVARQFLSADGTRTVGKRAQIRIEEVPGILLPDGYRTVGFIYGGIERTCQLATGYFADLTTLITAIRTAINNYPLDPGSVNLVETGTSRPILTNSYGNAWAPSIATAEIRYIWSLLGMATWNMAANPNQPAIAITADEIPFDLQVGDLAYEESNLKFQQFRRRPNS